MAHNNIDGSPGFQLLRPPVEGLNDSGRVKGRARLDGDNSAQSTPTRNTPVRHHHDYSSRPGPAAPWPSPQHAAVPTGPAQAVQHGLPPLPASRPHPPDGSHAGPHAQHGSHTTPHHSGSRRPPHEDLQPSGPPPRPRRMEPEAQWITRGGTGGGASYGGGSGYTGSFGGSHAGTSGGGGGTGHDGGRWASSSGGGGNQTASSSGGVSEPGVDRRFHDSFNSHRSPGKMPDYLKVYTVPKDVQYEEDIIVEPIIQSLGLGDKALEARIVDQMSNLYDFFRRLKDQDAEEIRGLQAALAARDADVRGLRLEMEREQQQHTQQMAAAAAKQQGLLQQLPSPPSPSRWRQGAPSTHTSEAAAYSSPAKQQPSPTRGKGWSGAPLVSLIVPPVLSPARPFFKWWANVWHCYQRRTTLWLGIAFLLLLILAIGLLAGLLSQDNGSGGGSSSAPPVVMPYAGAGPAVTSLWADGLAFTVNMTAGATAFYALVPRVSLMASNFTPSAEDVRALMRGPGGSSRLGAAASACGERSTTQGRQFTWMVTDSGMSSSGGSGGGGGSPSSATAYCEVPGSLTGACALCPEVLPGTAYMLLVAFSGSESLFQLPLTTAPDTMLPSTQPSSSPAASRAPDFTTAPSARAAGPASLAISLTLASPGIVRYLIMHTILYAQSGGTFVSYASDDPIAGQTLSLMAAPFSGVVGVGGAVAAGAVNVTQAGVLTTITVDGFSNKSIPSGALGGCSCVAGAGGVSGSCACAMPAPCLGAMCNSGPSALAPGATYKVFVSVSSPDGSTAAASTNGPVLAGVVTTAADTSGPALAPSTGVPAGAVTPTGATLSGIALDTSGIVYVMVAQPFATTPQQAIPAGTATSFTEQPTAAGARRRSLWAPGVLDDAGEGPVLSLGHTWSAAEDYALQVRRRLLQSSPPSVQSTLQAASATSSSGGALVVVDPLPSTQVFTPSCPRTVACDTSKIDAAYLRAGYELLAAPTRCLVLANVRDGPTSQLLAGLTNDTTYTLRLITEDANRNQRAYSAQLHTVDLRPPVVLSVQVASGFRAFNLTVTLSEPGAVTAFLYTTAAAANLTFGTQTSYPPNPQASRILGALIQSASAATTVTASDTPPSGLSAYTLAFNDPSIAAKTNYIVALFAQDLPGNVQPQVKVVPVSTEDNMPPVWLAAAAGPGPYDVRLSGATDEPALVWWFLLAGDVTCPTTAQLFKFVDSLPAITGNFMARGSIATVGTPANFGFNTSGLGDAHNYTNCMVAQDMSPQRNRQVLPPQRVLFTTLDRTPPLLAAAAMAGTDGSFTCDRARYICRLDLNVSLSEAGTALLALQYAPPPTAFPTATALLNMNLSDPAPGVLRAGNLDFGPGGGWQQLPLSTLASGRTYSLSIAAADTAGNIQPSIVTLTLTAPDVMPPTITRATAMSTADTVITANVTLNESPSTVLWLAELASSAAAAPGAAAVVAAAAAQQPLAGTAPYAPANNTAGQGFATFAVAGLTPGQVYNLYLVGRDAAGNTQAVVTTVAGVRTSDSSPPSIQALSSTTATSGNRLTLAVNASKAGTLYFLAIRAGGPVPSRQQLLQPATYPAPAFANFSGSVQVQAAWTPASAGLCVADGATFQIWAVLEDLEGTFPGRTPNYSNVTRAAQVLNETSSGSCAPRAAMRALRLDVALSSGSLGWPVSRLMPANDTGSNSSWVQDFALVGGLGGSVGSTGAVVASVEGLPLGAFVFQPSRPLPASIRVVLQTPTLYLEPPAVAAAAAADTGRVLRFAFQLLDGAQRSTVGGSGLRLVPSLTTSLAATSDGRVVLPECALDSGPGSAGAGGSTAAAGATVLVGGAGTCAVEVPTQVFPASGGSAAASLQVDLYNGTTLLVSSAALQVTLQSAITVSVAAPANGTTLLLSLPSRSLRTGETFRATLTAFVSSLQPITGFSLPLHYRSSRLSFVRAERSPLWGELDSVPVPDSSVSNGMQLWLTSLSRTVQDASYVGQAVPLLDAYFRVEVDAASVPAGGGLTVPLLSLFTNDTALYPYPAAPAVRLLDFVTAPGGGGSTAAAAAAFVVAPAPLALFAYVPNHDLFNTAVLDGNTVTSSIQALVVYDWADPANATLSAPASAAVATGCTCTAPSELAAALSLDTCRVLLRSTHTQPAKQAALSMDCGSLAAAAGSSAALKAPVAVTVWYPGTFRADASDPDKVLSSLLPINVPASAASSCSDRYQSSQLQLYATWLNGGNGGPPDYVSMVDVSRLVANWTSDQPQALRVSGITAVGLAATAGATVSALAADGSILASVRLAVSDTPVCVESLDAVALTEVTIAAADGASLPAAGSKWRLRFTPLQQLNWEKATARVSVFASLSDGSTLPVSRNSVTTAVQPPTATNSTAAAAGIPFRLQTLAGFASISLSVNASFGAPAVCGPYLQSRWSACSGTLPMTTGTGVVQVALPRPTAISAMLVSSASIAPPGSGAAQAPISVPVRASLTVLVAFDDGRVRDMTADSRLEVLVSQGADLCAVQRDATTNSPYVQAISSASAAGGLCRLDARLTFANLPQLTASNSTQVVTLAALQVVVVDGAVAPAAPPPYALNSSSLTALASPDVPLRLFKCDFSHYMPASVWVMGRLSSCGTSCTLADLNDPSATSLSLFSTTSVALAPNPRNARLANVLSPIRPGSTTLTVSFGSGAASASFNVSVEDTFIKGWPRVTNISDTGFLISANMTSAAFRVTYLVRRPLVSGDAVPTAAEVERVGVSLSAGTPLPGGATLMAAALSGLAPASNYSVFLAVRQGAQLLDTVVALTGVLTPDNVAPSFAGVGGVQNLTVDSQRFSMRLPVALSEAGNITFAIFRNASCISGLDQVPVEAILSGAPLPPSRCSCTDTSTCAPVVLGSAALSSDVLADTLSLSGLLPPNPYSVFRGATEAQLTCRTDPLPAPASTSHALYLVAADDLPTYRGWNVTCNPPDASPGSTCDAAAPAPCAAVPPPAGSALALAPNNLQALPYTALALKEGGPAQQGAATRPVLGSFDLPAGDRVAFDPAVTNITASAATITFGFRITRVAAVQYRLDQFNGASVFSGVLPVFDPSVPYSVSISRTCSGGLLDQPSYTLWYWATDVYGKSSPAVAASVVLQ
ncbi:hypothetical protein HXX76_001609 [Chlamydomonas incerta]|uniref:Uncharacterized protein n=1 Tax=Chlamydomonas incerta TaxID=51695 RepID=A0A835WCM5_CHLIN|nr:hypothetical protein HXX76_001609 [Chlamydomonas incerta]|eukprot:KAG2444871.1 hypothetical protein HXX76_001609 [Chlamydomonas incerta]